MMQQWRNHWFVLNDGCLYYFQRPGEPKPRCIIPLDNTRITQGSTETEFIITSFSGDAVKSSKFLEDGSRQLGQHPEFVLRASSFEDRDSWMKMLQEESQKFKPLTEIFLRKRDQVYLIVLLKDYIKWCGKEANAANDAMLTIPPPVAQVNKKIFMIKEKIIFHRDGCVSEVKNLREVVGKDDILFCFPISATVVALYFIILINRSLNMHNIFVNLTSRFLI